MIEKQLLQQQQSIVDHMPTIFKEATTLPLLLTVHQCINTFTRVLGEREEKENSH